MRVTLYNDFHATSCTLLVEWGKPLSAGQIKRSLFGWSPLAVGRGILNEVRL